MNQNVRTDVGAFVRFVPVYLIGCVVGVALLLLRALGIWKVTGLQNIPSLREKGNRGLMVISNHPSLLEPIALTGFFLRWYALRPFYGPWNMPDRTNYRRGFFRLMGPRLVYVDRKDKSSGTESFRRARELLNKGSVFILFPEGGRTFKGKPDELISGKKGGRKIRPFIGGAGLLAVQTNSIVIPFWVDGTDAVCPNLEVAKYTFPRFWRRVTISIGKPITFGEDVRAKEATKQLQTAVLDA